MFNIVYINPLDLIDYFKFGYEGDTIDLIYLLLIGFILFKFFKWLFKKIGGDIND